VCQTCLREWPEHVLTFMHVVDEARKLVAAILNEASNHPAELT
jgi:hypothetical protein